jgi:predicted ATPase
VDEAGLFIRAAKLDAPEDSGLTEYPWNIPAIRGLTESLEFQSPVTFLVGENGSGKSTIVEALAGAAGLNPEGGSTNFQLSTNDSHSELWESISLVRGIRRPKTDFFLRAESVYNVATYLDEMKREPFGGAALSSYGGTSLHEQSHGESFISIVLNRFGEHGLYFLDEPEAALSTQNCLTLLSRMLDLVRDGSQFVVATHSPILVAFPGATILLASDDGLSPIEYDEVPAVRLTRSFLKSPERFIDRLE